MGSKTKEEGRALLKARSLDGVVPWVRSTRGAMRALHSLAFDEDELTRWRAFEAIGTVAAWKAEENPDWVRDLLRRLFWTMNDESGATGWYAPEVIGEILVHVPALIGEYAGMLPHFFKEEPFERGAFRAVARCAAINPEAFSKAAQALKEALDDPDAGIRIAALSALDALGSTEHPEPEKAESLMADQTPVKVYDFASGMLRETTAGAVARETLLA